MGNGKLALGRTSFVLLMLVASAALGTFGVVASGALGRAHSHHRAKVAWHRYSLSQVRYLSAKELRTLKHNARHVKKAPKHPYVPVPKGTVNHAGVARAMIANSCTLPSAPGSPSAAGGSNQATVSWTAANGNGNTITNYVVSAIVSGNPENSVATPGTATSGIIGGLKSGSYTFQVFAQSVCGNGPAATTSSASVTGASSTFASTLLADGPDAYFRLGDASGASTAPDSSGNRLLGSYNSDGNIQPGQTGALPSDTATTSVLDNDANWVANVPAPVSLPIGNQPRTVMAWVKPKDGYCRWVLGFGTPNTNTSFNLAECGNAQSGGLLNGVAVSADQDDLYFRAPELLNDGNWHMIAVTYSGTSATAYLDGKSLGTKSFSAPLSTAASGLSLGSYDNQCCNNWAYGGLQDEAVFPTALSTSQITSLFNASGYAAPTAPTSPSATGSSNNTATVSWTGSTAAGTTVTGYIVTAKKGGTTAEQSKATPGSATSVTMTGLPAASYTFTVAAVDAYGSTTSVASPSVTVGGTTSTYASTVLADKPAVFYRLDEASSTSLAADSSGKNVTAFYSPPGCITQGVTGPLTTDTATAVNDSSACNYIAAETGNANLPSGSASRTLQAWVKPNDTNCRYFMGYGSQNTDQMFAVGNCYNAVLVSLYSDDHSFPSTRNIDDGNWHLITVTMTYSTTTGNSITAYLDGQKLGTQTTNPPATTAGTGIDIGSYPNSCCYYGSVADAAVYPSALSATAITALMTASGNGVPTAPTNVTGTGSTNKATVTWTAATVPSGTVSYYVVTAYQGTTAKEALAVPGNQTSATIDSLASGSYTFKVVAYDTYGAGPASAASSPATTVTGATSTYASTVLTSKPAMYYRLGETGNVPVAADSSGNGTLGYYGTLGSCGVTQGVTGAINDGSDLAASEAGCYFLAEAPGSAKIPAGDTDRTLEAWFKTTSGNCQYVAAEGTQNTDEAFAVESCSDYIVVSGYNDDHTFYAPRPLNDGAWHFVAAAYTDKSGVDQLTVYIDGKSLGTESFNSPLATPPQSTLWIGTGENNCCTSYNGAIDEVALFPAALASTAITAQFNASGNAVPGTPTGVSATPGANQATVSWTAPSSADPITSYIVTSYKGSTPGISEAAPGSATSATLTGLQGGTAYTFKVVAYDAYGPGSASAASAAVTPTGSSTTFASTVLSDGALAYYRLAEPSGTPFAADSSGNGQTAIYHTSVTTYGQNSALPSDTGTTVSDNGSDSVAVDENEALTANLPYANQPRTLLAWVKPGDANCRYAMGYGLQSTDQGFGMVVCPNQIGVVGYSDDHYFASPEPLNDGNWHQVAIAFDGTNITVYVDGSSLGTQQFHSTLNTPVGTALYLGGGPQDAGNVWDGGLAHEAVFGTALSAAQIQALFTASGYSVPTAPGSPSATGGANQATVNWTGASATNATITGYVVTAYKGATAENSVATNSSGSSVILKGLASGSYTFQIVARDQYGAGPAATTSSTTVTGTASTYASTVIGDGAVAYYRLGEANGIYAANSANGALGAYDQQSGCLTQGQTGALTHDSSTSVQTNNCWSVLAGDATDVLPSGSSARSVAYWFKPSNGQCWNYTMGYGTPQYSDDSFGVWVCPTNVYFWGEGDDTEFSTSNLDDGNWHQLVLTYDGTTSMTLYVDGTAVATQSISTPLSTPKGTELWIGSSDSYNGGSTGGTTGNMQDLAVFPTALSASQVTALYGAR